MLGNACFSVGGKHGLVVWLWMEEECPVKVLLPNDLKTWYNRHLISHVVAKGECKVNEELVDRVLLHTRISWNEFPEILCNAIQKRVVTFDRDQRIICVERSTAHSRNFKYLRKWIPDWTSLFEELLNHKIEDVSGWCLPALREIKKVDLTLLRLAEIIQKTNVTCLPTSMRKHFGQLGASLTVMDTVSKQRKRKRTQ